MCTSRIIRLRTTNDRNGNPRRLLVELNPYREDRIVDEGYAGDGAARITEAFGHCHYDGTTFDITTAEYRRLVKLAGRVTA